MKNFSTYARYLYNFMHIPIYLYDNQTFSECYPQNPSPYRPLQEHVQELFQSEEAVSYICIHNAIYFGKVKCDDNIHTIVIGPVAQISPNSAVIEAMAKDYLITDSEKFVFFDFYSSLPCLLLPSFLNLLLFVDCSINDMPSQKSEEVLTPWMKSQKPIQISEEQQEAFYDQSENDLLYDNFRLEETFVSIIENGDLNKLKEYARSSHQTAHYGTIAGDHIRQLKNMFIIMDVLVSRAAIRGGLSPIFSYQMCDSYMRQVETLWDEESIYKLMQILQIDFCKRVAETKKKTINDDYMRAVLDYVHANLNKKLNVEIVAHAVGLSRSYLSRRFKQELGFSLNQFICRCKLEEAKSLLLYTDKSISHISEYLCFSSQSYFQTLFKKQFGITPLECQKNKMKYRK